MVQRTAPGSRTELHGPSHRDHNHRNPQQWLPVTGGGNQWWKPVLTSLRVTTLRPCTVTIVMNTKWLTNSMSNNVNHQPHYIVSHTIVIKCHQPTSKPVSHGGNPSKSDRFSSLHRAHRGARPMVCFFSATTLSHCRISQDQPGWERKLAMLGMLGIDQRLDETTATTVQQFQ